MNWRWSLAQHRWEERLKERVDPAATTAEISEFWTATAIMAGLRFPWDLIKHCFGGITAMRESSTIQPADRWVWPKRPGRSFYDKA